MPPSPSPTPTTIQTTMKRLMTPPPRLKQQPCKDCYPDELRSYNLISLIQLNKKT
ncbi:unnamed protein product [Linum tenue]|uniref:Uncharacterized protein n=1 Tax=Linum tenue TaxID=586396 RepID=A0AAV0LHH2_9ROSI|nr:unnamed protein product [Linum tenue]